MTKKGSPCDGACGGRLCRRDFLKLAMAAGLLAGCTEEGESPVAPAEDFSQVAYCGIRCVEACPDHKYPTSCNSCKAEGGQHSSFWANCTIRECAAGKQVATCAHCDGYSECDDAMWKRYPMLRQNIDEIRSDLES